jgi:phosphatidylglycerophosphate synthase
MRRLVLLVAVASGLLLMALPAAADLETTTTVAEEGTSAPTVEPAVVAETPPTISTQPDWTYRYMIPTGLLLAALIVIITVVQYFVQVVRKRYRVVR